jgi:O-methyltransferase involved in polyketide biosynthesis/protein-S-isoprenylcysteine O-methyltransferase Ste14
MATAVVIFRFNPGLLAERLGPGPGAKLWDTVILSLLGLSQLGRYIIAGLDQRYDWTGSFPLAAQIAALMACVLGYALVVWATAANRFFSQIVRIQSERGHTVATSGPYRYVRHPAYIGAIIYEMAVSILLASWWAFIPGGLNAILLILRTALEDRTLQAELPGYIDYARRVRYRLVPLYIRALESQRPDALLKDDKAVALVAQMAPLFSTIKQIKLDEEDKVALVLRNRAFDCYTRTFLVHHPQAVVVHIGCGFDSRFERVDNSQVEWYDLDLPEVIDFRRKVIGEEGGRYHFLACSVFDRAWLGRVSRHQPGPFLFLAEGVLMYFEPAQVKALVVLLREHFPGAELIFDAFSPFLVRANKTSKVGEQVFVCWMSGSPLTSLNRGWRMYSGCAIFPYWPKSWASIIIGLARRRVRQPAYYTSVPYQQALLAPRKAQRHGQ